MIRAQSYKTFRHLFRRLTTLTWQSLAPKLAAESFMRLNHGEQESIFFKYTWRHKRLKNVNICSVASFLTSYFSWVFSNFATPIYQCCNDNSSQLLDGKSTPNWTFSKVEQTQTWEFHEPFGAKHKCACSHSISPTVCCSTNMNI